MSIKLQNGPNLKIFKIDLKDSGLNKITDKLNINEKHLTYCAQSLY